MGKPETAIREKIRLVLGGRRDCLILSNPSGLGVVGEIEKFRPGAEVAIVRRPRYQSFGLGARPGARGGEFPDLVGVRCVRITPEMVGQRVGIFLAVEVKTAQGDPSPGQLEKIALLRSLGCLAGVARSPEEAEELLEI